MNKPERWIDHGDYAVKLSDVLEKAEVANEATQTPVTAGPDDFAPPALRPPRVTPEAILSEFESDARYCEDMAGEIRAMLEIEDVAWTKLAAEYRALGQVQAQHVRQMLDKLQAMRDLRKQLAKALEQQ